ncbi:hypothetical protein OV079_42075 [Nannocystis pusilla]|uniref:Uncharacterized protein n=1 Tax=Nannocystis pusilla TaxID=889268 RepID=A0A9X3J1U4_9BACT|nr:hypothetical protein [Nannocystis pusilla]MCY1012026.1 hypothetical protein [Nannocystis pusilla]
MLLRPLLRPPPGEPAIRPPPRQGTAPGGPPDRAPPAPARAYAASTASKRRACTSSRAAGSSAIAWARAPSPSRNVPAYDPSIATDSACPPTFSTSGRSDVPAASPQRSSSVEPSAGDSPPRRSVVSPAPSHACRSLGSNRVVSTTRAAPSPRAALINSRRSAPSPIRPYVESSSPLPCSTSSPSSTTTCGGPAASASCSACGRSPAGTSAPPAKYFVAAAKNASTRVSS